MREAARAELAAAQASTRRAGVPLPVLQVRPFFPRVCRRRPNWHCAGGAAHPRRCLRCGCRGSSRRRRLSWRGPHGCVTLTPTAGAAERQRERVRRGRHPAPPPLRRSSLRSARGRRAWRRSWRQCERPTSSSGAHSRGARWHRLLSLGLLWAALLQLRHLRPPRRVSVPMLPQLLLLLLLRPLRRLRRELPVRQQGSLLALCCHHTPPHRRLKRPRRLTARPLRRLRGLSSRLPRAPSRPRRRRRHSSSNSSGRSLVCPLPPQRMKTPPWQPSPSQPMCPLLQRSQQQSHPRLRWPGPCVRALVQPAVPPPPHPSGGGGPPPPLCPLPLPSQACWRSVGWEGGPAPLPPGRRLARPHLLRGSPEAQGSPEAPPALPLVGSGGSVSSWHQAQAAAAPPMLATLRARSRPPPPLALRECLCPGCRRQGRQAWVAPELTPCSPLLRTSS